MKAILPKLLLVTTLAGTVSAQGLFAGLANRQEDIKKTKTAVISVIEKYDMTELLEGKLARKYDGSPAIALDESGFVSVDVQMDVNREKYDEWVDFATNAIAPLSIKILAEGGKLSGDDYRKPSIRIAGTTFLFPEDVKAAFKEIKESINPSSPDNFEFLCPPQDPAVFVYLVDVDGEIVAEPKRKYATDEGKARLTIDDFVLFDVRYGKMNAGASNYRVSAAMEINHQLDHLREKITGLHPGIPATFADQKCHDIFCLLLDPHDLTASEWGTLEMMSVYGSDLNFDYNGAKIKTVNFGKLPNEKLNEIQDVRVCVGHSQFVIFVKDVMDARKKTGKKGN